MNINTGRRKVGYESCLFLVLQTVMPMVQLCPIHFASVSTFKIITAREESTLSKLAEIYATAN